MQHDLQINWPAVIKHENDPELTYLQSDRDWQHYLEQEADLSDSVVDSSGRIFRLTTDSDATGNTEKGIMDLHDFLGLVKAHAAHKGSCCVAKLYAPDYAEAFKIIASLEDD